MNSPLPIRIAQLLLQQSSSYHLSPPQLSQLHSILITSGLQLNHFAALFRQIQHPTEWNLIIRHASANAPSKALSLFRKLRDYGGGGNNSDDPFICASLIKACNKTGALLQGKSLHCHVIRLGLDCNLNVSNSLISFYMGSANLFGYAVKLFDQMPERSVATFNSMISGFMKRGNFDEGLNLFLDMLRGRYGPFLPNYVTFVILLSNCVKFGEGSVEFALHCCCCKFGFDSNAEIGNVLVDLYGKLGRIDDAASVFQEMSEKDLISWNSMLSGYVNGGYSMGAFSLFHKMRNEGIKPDWVSLSCLLSVCGSCNFFYTGMMIHAYAKTIGLEHDVSVATLLINMYAKCREVNCARKIFDEHPNKTIESWNAMIHAYVENGLAREALKLYEQVRAEHIEPDEVTLLGLVLASRDTGEIHVAHSIIARSAIYNQSMILGNALIDAYAKHGSMEEARAIFSGMSRKDVISWTSMIVGYAMNGEGEKSLATFNQMCTEKFRPNSVTFIGVLSACDHAGLVDEGLKVYNMMWEVYRIKPGIEHCGCVVDMLARAGRVDDARGFIKNMPMGANAHVWRMLVNACKVHGKIDHGLSLVMGVEELNVSLELADYVTSSNMYAEAGRWGDVVLHRGFVVAQRASKEVGKSSLYLSPH